MTTIIASLLTAAALAGGLDEIQAGLEGPGAAAAATPELAAASSAGIFDRLALLRAPIRSPRPGAPPAAPAAGSFTEPTRSYIRDMRSRIERTSYERRVKDLLAFMVENSYQEDGRAAIEAVERLKPDIRVGDASSPFAAGEAWGDADQGEHRVVVDDRALGVHVPTPWERTNDYLMWEQPKSYEEVYGFVPEPIRGRTNAEISIPDEHTAATLLHELLHRATAVEAGESALASELRSHFAENRMTYLMEKRWGGSRASGPWKDPKYRLWRTDPKGYEEDLIRVYGRDLGKVDLRADEIETKRREILGKLTLGDLSLEREREAELRKAVKDYVDHLRRHTYQLWVLGLLDQDEKRRAGAGLDRLEDSIASKHLSSDGYKKEDYRRTLRRRLERLAADERLYQEVWRQDRAWRDSVAPSP